MSELTITREDRDFDRDEPNYRRGYEAALHPNRRGKTYSDVEDELRTAYLGTALDMPFREGYERGLGYRPKVRENRAGLKEFLLNALVLIGILGVSAFITSWFARTMYIRCIACGTLNARRRTECRSCNAGL